MRCKRPTPTWWSFSATISRSNFTTRTCRRSRSITASRCPSSRTTSTGRRDGKTPERQGWAETAPEYETAQDLANHLIRALVDAEFDITRCNKLREEIGVGHAFSFLYRRILPGGKLPMVPVMVNTYYPPNQPTPKRCYAFGQAVRKAVESWDSDKRVAIMASGGLSHVVIDEEIDAMVIDGLKNKKPEVLFQLPRETIARRHLGNSQLGRAGRRDGRPRTKIF